MLTDEMIHTAFVRAVAGLDAQYKALYTAMAAHLNTALLANGAAERDGLRSQISQLQSQINEMTDTVLRVEAERDAYQQIAQAKGGSDV